MYSVSRVVEMCRQDRVIWRTLSLQCLHRVATVDNRPLVNEGYPEIAEAIIEVLVCAMKCRLSCLGGFGDDDHFRFLDIPDRHSKNDYTPYATAQDCAIIHG
jgi:hypothetical protein